MILIGMYDSPFVRRVAVALRLYAMAYEHRPWSVFRDGDRIAAFNLLRRVPTLVLDDGAVLTESAAILDWLDEQAGDDLALIASSGLARRRALKTCALACGMADKAVSLVYERVLHDRSTAVWIERCRGQISGVLTALEQERAGAPGLWWTGERIGHDDIAVACALAFLKDALPEAYTPADWPTLAAHAARCEAIEAFAAAYQAFTVTPPK